MLTKTRIEVSCPACLTQFSSTRIKGLPKVRVKATDGRELFHGGETVIALGIHLCPVCGYAGDLDAFKHGEVDIGLRKRIAEELSWNLPWAKKSAVERFYHALKIAEWEDDGAKELGDLALYGSWTAQEVDDTESARYFQRAAIDHYILALRSWDGVEPAQRAAITYLVGELYRRIGDVSQALDWFMAAEEVGVASTNKDDKWVVTWSRIQRTEPKEFFL